ncbi:hypothetical protein IVB46_44255 [Bradyrhizobium sp. 61]|uniref:hypothetical protein n=1 Tax=Bradyrhizobium sp. 61 TaxID=2782679 RepID=UPI001FFA3822|nr:hypothetical protein [Bradyrhizobium sp. 61]MCK1282251.1 hypothetical protein [Bradyrhizobium sp. 61]
MRSEKSDRSSEEKMTVGRQSTLTEAAQLLRDIAGERAADESVKAVFRRLSRRLKGWSDSRVRDIWYRDERVSVRASEVEQLRAMAKAERRDDAGTNELQELRDRISRLERLLEANDEAFHSPTLAVLRDQERQVG